MGKLDDLLANDHSRLDALLDEADGDPIDLTAYDQFRRGLLRHIGIEEKILFPALRKRGDAAELLRDLHRDHAALAALLVPPPDRTLLRSIREILVEHNPLEEGAEGMYERAEVAAGEDRDALIAAVEAYPPVRTAPHSNSPAIWKSIERLLLERKDRES